MLGVVEYTAGGGPAGCRAARSGDVSDLACGRRRPWVAKDRSQPAPPRGAALARHEPCRRGSRRAPIGHALSELMRKLTDMERPVQAVVFDFFGTLTPPRPDALRAAEKHSSADILAIDRERWIAELDAVWEQRIRGELGDVRSVFRHVARRLGQEPSERLLAAAVKARLDDYVGAAALRPGALRALTELKAAGFALALVTDTSPELPEVWGRLAVAPLFDATVFSCVEGTRKPDPAMFLAACDRLGLEPNSCLYVGDGGSNELAGASAVGMRAVMFKPEDWDLHPGGDRPAFWSGPTVAALPELLASDFGFGTSTPKARTRQSS